MTAALALQAVADIIESLFGAVYIDSGFDPAAPQQIFDHCLAPFFQKWISPTSLKLDCIRILLERAQAAQCDDGGLTVPSFAYSPC